MTTIRRVLESYDRERSEILQHAKDQNREVSQDEAWRLASLYSEHVEAYLDAGHGACWLRDPLVAGIVCRAMQHFAGVRYALHAWTAMPNHVHAVLSPLGEHHLSRILHSWKSFTAHEAASRASHIGIGKDKPFWQRESYDHLVRSEQDFERVCRYTIQNPVEAGLCLVPEDWPYLGGDQL